MSSYAYRSLGFVLCLTLALCSTQASPAADAPSIDLYKQLKAFKLATSRKL